MKTYFVVAKNIPKDGEKPWSGEMEVGVRSMKPEHFDEKTAKEAMSHIRYTDNSGAERTGAHWSIDQVRNATASMKFPAGTTDWDKYVALNVFYSDLCKVLTDDLIIKSACRFFFQDEDAPDGKLCTYMKAMK